MKTPYLFILVYFLCSNLFSQNQATAFPATAANDSLSGNICWINPSNAEDSDGVFSTVSLVSANPRSAYLVAGNFGFNLSSTAKIQGITAQVYGHHSLMVFGDSLFSYAKLVKAGVIQTDSLVNKLLPNKGNNWIIFGGCDSLWKNNWTYSDINNSGFGIAYYALVNGGGTTVSVDAIKVSICYTESDGINSITQNTEQKVLYPNPTSGNLFIPADGVYQLEIFDICGKLLDVSTMNGPQYKDLSCLANGLYYIRVSCSKEHYLQKVVIQK